MLLLVLSLLLKKCCIISTGTSLTTEMDNEVDRKLETLENLLESEAGSRNDQISAELATLTARLESEIIASNYDLLREIDESCIFFFIWFWSIILNNSFWNT